MNQIERRGKRRRIGNKHNCQWIMTKLKENVQEAEEDHCAPLNQILHMSRYGIYAIGHASGQVANYEHIHGLYCLIGRLIAEFAKQSLTLIRFVV